MVLCVHKFNCNMLFTILRKMWWNVADIIFISTISVLPSNYFIVAFLSDRFLLLYDDEF